MEHTKIVSPDELENFANRRDSEPIIPELVWLLITTSCKDLTLCRIPYHDASIGLPGLDGLIQTESGFRHYVPRNTSFWEMGRGERAQAKATNDYRKRTKKTTPEERAQTTFVFVTPRSRDWEQGRQAKWIKRRNKTGGWAQIKIIDGIQLCDWLREFPGIGKWLAQRIGLLKLTTGLRTPAEHWETLEKLREGDDPPLPTGVFLIGREEACSKLQQLFTGERPQLLLAIENENDADDFVAAFLQSLDQSKRDEYGSRCLFISEAEAWHTFSNLRTPHVLVADPRLDLSESFEQLHIEARARGHGVVIPVLGAHSYGNDEVIPILSPSRTVIEQALVAGQFTAERAAELASIGAHSLSALKRSLRGLGKLPPYSTWDSAPLLAKASLVGKWRGDHAADREALEILLGKSYGEWIDVVRPETLRPDTPLFQRNETWKVISRGEAWAALGPYLSDNDLDKFKEMCVKVLGETNRQFDATRGEDEISLSLIEPLPHSRVLRAGLAESLALVGCHSSALTTVSQGKAEAIARLTVRGLLARKDWRSWASLNDLLPLLAEAAPEEFLDALEGAMADPSDETFQTLFRLEGKGFGGRNYMTGILWGLETLAWSPDYLGRVTLILGDLASIDPGGNWNNRPRNSLLEIYLPWYYQTMASLAQRIAALDALLRETPNVAWGILLDLLPTMHGATTGTRKPSWRTFVTRGWRPVISRKEYWEQVRQYSDLCISVAQADLGKLTSLVDRLPNIPEPAYSRILAHLGSQTVTSLPDVSRRRLWETLRDLVAKHRRFQDARWALPEEQLAKIEKVNNLLEPTSYELAHLYLFTERDWDLYENNEDFESAAKELARHRQSVVLYIIENKGPAGLIDFAMAADAPYKVGEAGGAVRNRKIDETFLPSLLNQSEKNIRLFIGAFIWSRYWAEGIEWVGRQLELPWEFHAKLAFLLHLPPERSVWERAERTLGDRRGEYWGQVRFNAWSLNDDADLIWAAERLTAYGQPATAVDCLAVLAHKKSSIPVALAESALVGAVNLEGEGERLVQHNALEVIKWLQQTEASDSDVLFKLEWSFLPLLNRLTGAEPKALERRLAGAPEFFCELVRRVFRSDNEDLEQNAKPTEEERRIARNAYSLLHGWQTVPGMIAKDHLDGEAFENWLDSVKSITKASGHFGVAMNQIGQMLVHAPRDPDGLWIHRVIAAALDSRDAGEMRRGFSMGLYNSRGVHGFSGGAEEYGLAAAYKTKAQALSEIGYMRAAEAVREVALGYEREARREATTDVFDDL